MLAFQWKIRTIPSTTKNKIPVNVTNVILDVAMNELNIII